MQRPLTPVGVMLTACLLVLTACSGGDDSGSKARNDSNPTASDSSDSSSGTTNPGLPVTRAHHVTVFHDTFSGFMTTQRHPNRLWSGSPEGLGWIDPRTNDTHVVDQVPGVNIDVRQGYLYRAALFGNDVARYDVSGNPRELQRRRAPAPLNILAGRPGLWTSDHFHGRLLRLDPATMKIVKRVRIGSGKGLGPAGLVWQGKNLWVNVKRDMTVALVDGRTGRVLHRVHLSGTDIGDDITRTSAGIWASAFHGDTATTLALIDSRRFRVIARISLGPDSLAMPVQLGGETWMAVGDQLLHLSPQHGWQPDRAVDLHVPGMNARWAVAAFGSIWVTTVEPSRIIRVPAQDLE